MKQDTTLFIFALILAFLTGNITYLIKSDQKVDINDIAELNAINKDIQTDYAPLLRLDLNSEYASSAQLELLKTPHVSQMTKMKIDSQTCLKNEVNQLRSEFLDKETLWLSYLCEQINELPKDFFKTAPFMHASGESYAYLYYNKLRRSKFKQRWYLLNAKYMHIDELKMISWPLSQSSQFLYSVDQTIIDRIIANEKVIFNKDYYLLRTGNMKYFILDSYKAINYFKRAGYLVTNNPTNCFIKIGNVCWNKKPHNIVSFLSQSSIIIFITTVLVFLLTANTLYQRIRHQKKEEERKKHALRVLTHELRTPVASLLLKINQLSDKVSELPPDIADNIINIENDIYRLKHLAEKSQSYLQTDSEDLLNLKPTVIEMSELCQEIISEYQREPLELNIPENFSLYIDKYWFKMCITNLIDNAIRYGKSPIKIEVTKQQKYCLIDIIDQGEIKYQSLKELMSAKHTESKGLGLGLVIIKKTLNTLGGDLLFSTNPTKFTIKLKILTKDMT